MGSVLQSGHGTEHIAAVSRGRLWTGRAIGGLVAVFMLIDVAMKFMEPQAFAAGFVKSGWPLHLSPVLGWILLASTLLFLIPRTAVLGAILLTGYLGGAAASNLRLGLPLFSITLSPVYVGVLAWGALWLRDPAICALIPLRGDH